MTRNRLQALNTSGETAPAFGIAEVADAAEVTEAGAAPFGESTLVIRKPTGTGRVVAVGTAAIEDERYGAVATGDVFVRFTGSDPTPGDTLHATSGSWELSAGGSGTGVTVAGDVRDMGSYKIVRVEIGGGSGSGGGLTLGMLYENMAGQTYNEDGDIIPGATARVLPLVAGTAPNSLTADLDAEFVDVQLWDLAGFAVGGESCCTGGSDGAPTGPRITFAAGPDGINRFATGDTLAGSALFSGTGGVPSELLTLTLQAINPTTGATTGSVITWTNDGDTNLINNDDGTWDTTAESLSGIARGLCLVKITNGSTIHAGLVLNSKDEWTPITNSRASGDPYFDGKPEPPNLQAASDTGGSSVDDITDDDTPSFSVTFSGATYTPATDTHGLLYAINQSTAAVTVVTGTGTDFDSGLTITKTIGSALADGFYEFQFAIYNDRTGGGYTYNTWYSPPSNPLRVQIVADADAVETARYAHLCMYTTIGGVVYASPGRCRRPITADEITKLDA